MLAHGVRWFTVVAAILWLALAGSVRAEVVPLAAPAGRCECVLATPSASDQFYLIVGSLADAAQTTQICVRTETTTGPEFVPVDKAATPPDWNARLEAQARTLERARPRRFSAGSFTPLGAPPTSKTFHLYLGDRDLENRANYQEVRADLSAVGRYGQVYLDRDDKDLPGIDATIAEVLRVFDNDIYPWAENNLGRVVDVDRDGRFSILLTGKMAAMQSGKTKVDGFVRGSDFFHDLPAPFSNHCDMLYLNAALKAGPQLRTVLAHEYAHAVIFCEHALASYHGSPSGRDEEGWLNEGLAHLVEVKHNFGWSNLDHRISAFLARPEQYPLIVPDYFTVGLWRDPGTRGATFLFVRSCAGHADPEMLRRLVQTPLRGVSNLEAATRQPFADLFRQATLDFLDARNYGYLDKNKDAPLLCGPRFHEVVLHHGHAERPVVGTAAALFLLHSPGGTHTRVTVECTGPVQVTLVRVARDYPRLALRWVDEAELEVRAHYGTVVLRGAGWENATRQQLLETASAFEPARLTVGTTMHLKALALPGGTAPLPGPFKVLAEDYRGRPVAAWIDWPLKSAKEARLSR